MGNDLLRSFDFRELALFFSEWTCIHLLNHVVIIWYVRDCSMRMPTTAYLLWTFCLGAYTVSGETTEEWRTRIDARIDRVRKADAEIRQSLNTRTISILQWNVLLYTSKIKIISFLNIGNRTPKPPGHIQSFSSKCWTTTDIIFSKHIFILKDSKLSFSGVQQLIIK